MEALVQNTSHDLRAAVIKTVAFFDLFDFPLTPLEVLRDINQSGSLQEVREILTSDNRLAGQEGFYFLRGRSDIIEVRKKRHNYSARKLVKAKIFSRLFGLFPGVQMVALANSIGYFNLRDDSDIDFFIITKPGYLWLSRLYCTGLTKLLGSRPTAKTKRDKICLSFYLSASGLAISSLRLSGDDPYFDRWHRHLILLYNNKGTYQNFLVANNNFKIRIDQESVSAVVPGILERLARSFQLKVMPAALRTAAGNSDGVVINNQVLKFYQRDRRREFAKKYVQKITTLFGDHN